MANNRFQIYCKKCLEMAPFSKYYNLDWGGISKEAIDNFCEEHNEKCWRNDEKADIAFGTEMYGFRTESDEDEFTSDYRTKPFKLTPAKD